jgi:hypothetical protein
MPIEMVFSQWRRLVCREELDNEDVLINRILNASKKISKELCINCIDNSIKKLKRCLEKEDF